MNKEEHTKRHIKLYESLDELFADAIIQANLRATNSIFELIEWSHKQIMGVDHGEGVSDEGDKS